jgi:hypothetical protein
MFSAQARQHLLCNRAEIHSRGQRSGVMHVVSATANAAAAGTDGPILAGSSRRVESTPIAAAGARVAPRDQSMYYPLPALLSSSEWQRRRPWCEVTTAGFAAMRARSSVLVSALTR